MIVIVYIWINRGCIARSYMQRYEWLTWPLTRYIFRIFVCLTGHLMFGPFNCLGWIGFFLSLALSLFFLNKVCLEMMMNSWIFVFVFFVAQLWSVQISNYNRSSPTLEYRKPEKTPKKKICFVCSPVLLVPGSPYRSYWSSIFYWQNLADFYLISIPSI